MTQEIITDADRYPTLSPHGERMLKFLREHPHAPIYRNRSGNRLTAQDVEQVRAFERMAVNADIAWQPGRPPQWIGEFVARSLATVPFYREYGSPPSQFTALPTINRGDLSRDIAQFVPDDIEIERLINFRTSGTTGHPLLVASHPRVAAQYLGYHKRALRRFGVELRAGRGQVGVVLIGLQSKCFTYVSVTPTMDEAGLAKINLHPNDWHHLDDRAKYLDALAPEVIAGDPISFAELARLPVRVRPRALLSTSMALSAELHRILEDRFGCPVLDVYSMNEAGPIAVADKAAGGHVLLQHRMYVEILDTEGQCVPEGERGEVTITGGFNFCLPLLRYRTGDYASLERRGADLVLIGLQGRPPVRYRTMFGEWINNIEVTHALGRLPIVQYTLHQTASGALRFRYHGAYGQRAVIEETLLVLFGRNQELQIEEVTGFTAKVVQCTSELPGSAP